MLISFFAYAMDEQSSASTRRAVIQYKQSDLMYQLGKKRIGIAGWSSLTALSTFALLFSIKNPVTMGKKLLSMLSIGGFVFSFSKAGITFQQKTRIEEQIALHKRALSDDQLAKEFLKNRN